ncbi:MAG: DUF4203 domain-containing protein [Elainella sp.]
MLKTLLLFFVSGLFGGLLCFAGYRFFLVMLPVWSFFGGLWLGMRGFQLLLGEGLAASVTGLTVGVLLGLGLAVFSWLFYDAGVALLGAITTAWLTAGLLNTLGLSPGLGTALIALGCAAVVGVLTYLRHWQKYLVILLTAIAGANALVLALLLPAGRVSVERLQLAGTAIRPVLQESWLWSLIWLGLAIAGIIMQWRAFRRIGFAKQEFVRYWS